METLSANVVGKARRVRQGGRDYLVVPASMIPHGVMNGSQGPDLTKYLAGGGVKLTSRDGTFVSRNLTSDGETGLAHRSDDEVKRVLQSGTFPDGHVVPHTMMPWANFSHWTDEDRHAVVVYLRSLPAVTHRIPDPSFEEPSMPDGAIEGIFGLKDYGIN